MSADPQDIKSVVEGAASLLSIFGLLPAAIVAPLILLSEGIAGLFRRRK